MVEVVEVARTEQEDRLVAGKPALGKGAVAWESDAGASENGVAGLAEIAACVAGVTAAADADAVVASFVEVLVSSADVEFVVASAALVVCWAVVD